MTAFRPEWGRRPTTRLWWWVASLALVAAGVAGGIVAARSGPAVGPSLERPLGQVYLDPSQLGTLPGVDGGETTTTDPAAAGLSSTRGAVGASLAVATTAAPSAASGATSITPSMTPSAAPSSRPASQRYIPRSRPVRIEIPAIGVRVRLDSLGLNRDHSVQVPASTTIAGWYRNGPAPGQQGSAVILGHVDSYRGPGVFMRIHDLRPGQSVVVTLANGYVVRFTVIGLREYSKNAFPDAVVYGTRPYAALQLVTCGGAFDRATGHYESNVVVYTVMSGWTAPRR